MKIQEKLRYTKDHEWVRVEGNMAFVGITDFAQGDLGDIVYIEIESLDETFDKDEVFGSIEAVKTVSDLFMPLSGEVLEINEKIESNPELVNTDPYGEGWLIKISINDVSETESLLSSEEYRKEIDE